MNNRVAEILGKLLMQEVGIAMGESPMSVRADIRSFDAQALVADGLIFAENKTVGQDKFGAITVPFYSLTERGHYLYTEYAATQGEATE